LLAFLLAPEIGMEGKRRLSHLSGIIGVVALVAACVSTAGAATFTLVAMPDIQNETQYHPEMLQAQVNWILNNQASQNIVFVAQQGDLTNNATIAEFTTAHNALFQLSGLGGMPWGTCPGNHDLASPDNYDSYFGPSNFTGQNWYGSTTNGHSSYQIFQGGGRSYLVLNIAYDAPSPVLDWAQGVINDHRGMPTIINTHDYMAYGNKRSSYGNTLWNRLVNNNPQVFMVLCGHNHYAYSQTSLNAYNKPVLELLADYQELHYGDGYLRLYQFDEANSVIHVKTFSPYDITAPYLTDSLNQFDIPLDFHAQLDPVPEPTTVVLAVMAAAILLAYEWRRRWANRWSASA
jgi:hypothetical protein